MDIPKQKQIGEIIDAAYEQLKNVRLQEKAILMHIGLLQDMCEHPDVYETSSCGEPGKKCGICRKSL